LSAPLAGTDLANGAPSVGAFVLRQGNGVPAVQVDELRVDRSWAQVTPPPGITWIADADDAWSVGTRWSSSSPPDAADAFVNFGSAINSPRTVTLDSSRLVRTLNFNNIQRYTIAATGGANLTFSGS